MIFNDVSFGDKIPASSKEPEPVFKASEWETVSGLDDIDEKDRRIPLELANNNNIRVS